MRPDLLAFTGFPKQGGSTHKDTPRRVRGVALFLNESGKVLLVKPNDQRDGRWTLPGGEAHGSETPHEAARRQVREQTGLTLSRIELLAVDSTPTNRKEDAVEGLTFVFHGWTIPRTAEITLQEAELDAYGFVPLARLNNYVRPCQERRIRAAAAATGTGRTAYLVWGQPAT
ncbi:NUDIX domain-containing protein [Streptomyces silvisoli]|uniref:NUDIX hydrolase n=1 Tax=Streptomyces silvisoli TaxID=3034235 RepID=A0ABT5ZJX6_9ACTN|nr:NUDIX hydrolase [Streptomyces silvisoli]MDF3290133.1 NUDIX hydrolase [Streptomyces silvisoli]